MVTHVLASFSAAAHPANVIALKRKKPDRFHERSGEWCEDINTPRYSLYGAYYFGLCGKLAFYH
jgi:hypothetical protein